ncbi:hypothetical protein KY342_02075 [Candidatus Woesearchaeota archaeon]|nr:hypothetical protein [Candidatus Woesearchaeota archaeon]
MELYLERISQKQKFQQKREAMWQERGELQLREIRSEEIPTEEVKTLTKANQNIEFENAKPAHSLYTNLVSNQLNIPQKDAEYATNILGDNSDLITFAYSIHINNNLAFTKAVGKVSWLEFTKEDKRKYDDAKRLSEEHSVSVNETIDLLALTDNYELADEILERNAQQSFIKNSYHLGRSLLPEETSMQEIPFSNIEHLNTRRDISDMLYGNPRCLDFTRDRLKHEPLEETEDLDLEYHIEIN